MDINDEMLQELIEYADKLRQRSDSTKARCDDCFDPEMEDNMDQYYGEYDLDEHWIRLKTNVKGLRYNDRSSRIEHLYVGDGLKVIRDPENAFNPNNFMIHSEDDDDVGNMPAELCNLLAPLYDAGIVMIESASVSYIEQLIERSRYAEQGVLFVDLLLRYMNQEI